MNINMTDKQYNFQELTQEKSHDFRAGKETGIKWEGGKSDYTQIKSFSSKDSSPKGNKGKTQTGKRCLQNTGFMKLL